MSISQLDFFLLLLSTGRQVLLAMLKHILVGSLSTVTSGKTGRCAETRRSPLLRMLLSTRVEMGANVGIKPSKRPWFDLAVAGSLVGWDDNTRHMHWGIQPNA